jgi:multicomponent Na+:H+ antiporter subunit D
MIGLPPTAGFISKWYLLGAAWETESSFVVTVVILSTLLNAGYFLPIVYRAWFRAPAKTVHHHADAADGLFGDPDTSLVHAHDGEDHDHGEAPWPMVVALCLTAAATVAFFFYADPAIDLAVQLRKGLLP